MTRATLPPKMLAGPPCAECGGATRIVSIEPHKRLKRRQTWTVECTACGETRDVPMLSPRRMH
jgi:uncharacterized Zn finger protein